MKKRVFLSSLAVVFMFLFTGCLTKMYTKSATESYARGAQLQLYTPVRDTITNGTFAIIIEKFESGNKATNYYLYAKVKNIGEKEVTFDSGDLELFNEEGLSYYSISKDTDSVSVPIGMADLITNATLKPGRMIQGKILFTTSENKARDKKITLEYGKNKVVINWLRQKSAEDFAKEIEESENSKK